MEKKAQTKTLDWIRKVRREMDAAEKKDPIGFTRDMKKSAGEFRKKHIFKDKKIA